MKFLDKDLRKQLEKSIIKARNNSETGARSALERLAVGQAEPFKHLSPEEREIRVWLRAHGRQLGDILEGKIQTIDHLVSELSYEYWHRMLFARFLAENNLLMHPEGVPVSLAECDELATELKGENLDGWTLAARYASQMLPQIFRPDDRLLQIPFAPEHKLDLEKILNGLSCDVFTADDSLGWCYQFWQSERKEQVNRSGNKINADTLPAVTQLFTEHYMVEFLLHNTIGAWWAGKQKLVVGNTQNPEVTEDQLRKQVSLPGYEFTYLRFIVPSKESSSPSPPPSPARGEGEIGGGPSLFRGQDINEISSPLKEEGLNKIPSPLRGEGGGEGENILPATGTFPGWPKSLKEFKLLDPCCGSGHFLVAAFDLMVRIRIKEEGLPARDACDAVIKENLHGLELDPRCTQIAAFALALAAWTFPDAGGYRSLPRMNIACCGIAPHGKREDWVRLANGDTRLSMGMKRLYDLFQDAPDLGSLIEPHNGDLIFAEFADLQPLLEKALQLDKAQKDFDLAATGVAAQGIADAACLLAGKYHLVITNVPYLGRGNQGEILKKFCQEYYSNSKHDLATVFVERCLSFCESGGSIAMVTPQNWLFLTSYKNLRVKLLKGVTWNIVAKLGEGGFESNQAAGAFTALSVLTKSPPPQEHLMVGVDASDIRDPAEKAEILKKGQIDREYQVSQLQNPDSKIALGKAVRGPLLEQFASGLQGISPADFPHYGRCFWEVINLNEWFFWQSTVEEIVFFGGRQLILWWSEDLKEAVRKGIAYIRGESAWNKMGVVVSQMRSLPCTLYTGEKFDTNCAVIVPHNPSHLAAIWAFCSSSEYREAVRRIDQKLNVTNATLVKVPFDLARWQKVAKEMGPLPEPHSNDPTQWLFKENIAESTAPLQVAIARLLGYRWPGKDSPSPPPSPTSGEGKGGDDLDKFVDEDGIICIPAVRGEKTAAEHLREILAVAYGEDWSPGKQEELLASVEFGGNTLEDWLRNGFFEQHCKLFHQRPFIWQIWDGRRDGFSVLVNYHKLDRQNLEKLTYTYVGDWIKRQEDGSLRDEGGAEARLLAARQLQEKLKLIIEGEYFPEKQVGYDIFVRWKPVEKQPIGWEPDLNDGVRLNIRPFIEADILRKRPNINWNKDRGKNPPGSPWGEERINDLHLTLKEKREIREKTKKR